MMLKLKLQHLGPWCEELAHWKRPWCWERLRAGGEGDNRGWDGWMASLTQWTWVWVNSRSWWWTGRPGVLQSMGSQRVGHSWATELNEAEVQCPPLWKLAVCLCSVAWLCLNLCNPMDYSPTGFSVHGIFLIRILVWVASVGYIPDPGIEPAILASSALQGDSLLLKSSVY